MGPVSHQSWEVSVIGLHGGGKRPSSLEWQLEDVSWVDGEGRTQVEPMHLTHQKKLVITKIDFFLFKSFSYHSPGIPQGDPWPALTPIAIFPSELGTD